MTKFISCKASDIVVGYVVRWFEGFFEAPGGSRRGARKRIWLGDREVTAQVIEEADREGYLWLEVIECTAGEIKQAGASTDGVLKKGAAIERARSTLEKGEVRRKVWDHEAPGLAASKFIKPEAPPERRRAKGGKKGSGGRAGGRWRGYRRKGDAAEKPVSRVSREPREN